MNPWKMLTVLSMLLTFIICFSVGCGEKPEPAKKEAGLTTKDVADKAKAALAGC